MVILSQTESEPWWNAYSEMLHPAYRSLIMTEQTARHMQAFTFNVLPGLVQTERYSRAITVGSQLLPLSDEEQKLFSRLRIERQWHVFEKPTPPQFDVIIDEPALYRQVGGLQVLCEELQHLVRLARMPHITIRVLPMSRPIDYSGDFGINNFILLVPPSGKTGSLYLEQASAHTQSFTNVPATIRRYKLLFGHLWQASLSAEKSVTLIENTFTALAKVSAHE